MRLGGARGTVALMLLAAAFTYGLAELYRLRLVSGDIYPVYSSFRADPLGTKLLYESLGQLDHFEVQRSFEPLDRFRASSAVLLYVGQDPFNFVLETEDDLKQLESIASHGNRVVIAMQPVNRPLESDKRPESAGRPIEKRWGVSFSYITRTKRQPRDGGPLPKVTALIMRVNGARMRVFEKQFGRGSVVLLDNAYELSNEAVAAKSGAARILELLAGRRSIVFDEYHLGLRQEASIAMLARKYRLGGLVAGLLMLAGLFVWKNSAPLLPVRGNGRSDGASPGKNDANAALANLLRRYIPSDQVISTCVQEWERSGHGGRYYAAEKVARVRESAQRPEQQDIALAYRRIADILSKRD